MSKQQTTTIEQYFTRLSRRAGRAGAAADDDAAVDRQLLGTPHAVQTSIGAQTNGGNTDSSGQPPEPSTFTKKIQDMLSTFPSFPSSGRSEPSLPTPSASPQTAADNTLSPVREPHLPISSVAPNSENGSSEHSWQSVWSALDRLRSPYAKKTELPGSPVPSQSDILDCVDDNNSIMMYGPLEPDETSEVEIACSEIVSVNGDGEEVRTPQPCYVPLPSESFDEVPVVGSPGRSPLSRFIPLPLESIDQVLIGAGRSPPSYFASLSSGSVDRASSGGRSPQSRFAPLSPLPLESIDRVLSGGWSPQPRFAPFPSDSTDQAPEGGSGESSSIQHNANELDRVGTAQVPPNPGSPGRRPPVKEYRVWLPSLTKISVQTMWWGFRIYLPPPVLDVLNNKQLEAVKRAAIITTALQWLMEHLPVDLLPPQVRPGMTVLRLLVPYVGYMGGFIAWGWSAIRSFDKGYGVVLTATWLLPFVLIPGTWEADQVSTLNTPQSTHAVSP